jgi:hypothetical protein
MMMIVVMVPVPVVLRLLDYTQVFSVDETAPARQPDGHSRQAER